MCSFSIAQFSFNPEEARSFADSFSLSAWSISVRRLSVLIMIGEREGMETIQASWDISEPTVCHRLKEFVAAGWKSLVYGKMSGRPSRLSKTQKRRLSGWIKPSVDYNGETTPADHLVSREEEKGDQKG